MQDKYEAHVTRMTADQYWERIKESGWLSELPEADHDELENDVRETFLYNPVYAWETLAVVSFDSESIHGIDPEADSYHAHLVLLAEATHGVFHPTNIQNEYVDHHIKVSFEHKGDHYEFETPAETTYFNPDLISVINDALKQSGSSKQFISLPATDQMYHFVFVSEQTYRHAEQLMIIPPPEYFVYLRHGSSANVDAYLDEYYDSLSQQA